MAVRFVVVPQWQGSGSARAMQLVDGAGAIRGDLPSSATLDVEVPLEAGDSEGTGIQRFSSVRVVRQRFAQATERVDETVITIGGDCSADYAGIARSVARHDAALVWIDAHADAETPQSSPSKAFHGQVVRALVDDGVIAANRVVYAGTREWAPAEEAWVAEAGIPVIDVEALRDPASLIDAIAATGATAVHLHIDLDVLDPAEIDGIAFPEPFGLTVGELVALVRAAGERFALAGAAICEFSPASVDAAADDMPTILRVIAALTAR